MKLLVMSDSHGDFEKLDRAAEIEQPDTIAFLGDGLYDLTRLRLHCKKPLVAVKGNCDVDAREETTREFKLEGVKIFITHGHLYGVKYGYANAIAAAKSANADILLFGHTHIQAYDITDELHVINPGSIRNGRYAVIEITDGKPVCELKNLK